MEDQYSSSFDRISDLPSHISQTILTFMPLRDMVTTSILSKKWRFPWGKVPQLVFKDERYKYSAMNVFGILLLHHGPISKFTLDMTAWLECSEIDKIIPVLSRNGIKELTLLMPKGGKCFKLPSSILSCVELRHLSLSSCVFQPLTIVEFNKLVSLELLNVTLDSDVSISSCPSLESLKLDVLNILNLFSIDAPKLNKIHFEGMISRIGIMNTPLLKVLRLSGHSECYTENSSSDFRGLLHSLPLLEHLSLTFRFLQVLTEDDSSVKFPMLLDNVRMLELRSVDVRDMEELSSTLCLIRSSPNLQKLKFIQFGHSSTPLATLPGSGADLILLEHARDDLLKLQEVEILLHYPWCYLRRDIEFFKFLLDISPALKKLYIKATSNTIDVRGYKMLVELARYGRASRKSEIVYAGVDLS